MEERGDEVPVWLSSEQKPVPAAYPVLRNFEPDIDTFYEEWLGKKGPDRRQRQRRCDRSDEREHRVVGRA